MDKPREVDKDIVNAEIELRFDAVESTAESAPDKGWENTHPWAKQIINDHNKKISFKRRLRIDFVLRNTPLRNPTLQAGKYEYKLFDLRWPALSIVQLNKRTGQAALMFVTNFGAMNTNVLVEGVGNFFLNNSYLSERFDTTLQEEKILKSFSDPVFDLHLLDKPNNLLEVSIVAPQKFPEDRNYEIRGHCLLGGALISADRNSFWFPFDSYRAPLDFIFPFKQTDISLKIAPLDGFSVRPAGSAGDPMRNIKAEGGKPTNLALVMKRTSVVKQYIAPLLAVIFTLLIAFLRDQNAALRALTYFAAFAAIYFATLPVGAISACYPLRIGFALLVGNAMIIREYLNWYR